MIETEQETRDAALLSSFVRKFRISADETKKNHDNNISLFSMHYLLPSIALTIVVLVIQFESTVI